MSILLLLITCFGTAAAIRLLQRWPRVAFLATGVGSILLMLILLTATSEPVNIAGRALTLAPAGRVFLWPAILITAALAFFGPLTFERAGDTPFSIISNSQGSFFFLSLSPLIISMALDSFPLAAFFWGLGLMLLILLAQPRREGRAGGAAQFLLLVVVATSSLLIANRFLDLYALTPENLGLMRSAFLFLAWGLGILLAVAPLHLWLGPMADEMPTLGIAFLTAVAQPVGLWLLFQLMSRLLWLVEKSPLLSVLFLAGAVTAPSGAILSLAEHRHGRFVAYLSLVSMGHILIGLGLGTRLGLSAAMLAMFNRALGIVLLSGGFVFLRHHEERKWQVVGAMSIIAGGMALAGIAPALGGAARWGLYRQLAAPHPLILGLLLASNAAALFAVLRMVTPLIRHLSVVPNEGETAKIVPYLCAGIVALLIAVLVLLGLFPQVLADPVTALLGTADYIK